MSKKISLLIIGLFFTVNLFADDYSTATSTGNQIVVESSNISGAIKDIASDSNTLFILLGAIMILAMHGGFAFLEVGSVRKKNQVNALNKIICEWSFSAIIYFLIGYPIARGVSFLVPVSQMASNG